MPDALVEALKLLRAEGRDDLANALAAADEKVNKPPPTPAPRVVEPQTEDDLWQEAASRAAWTAIRDARARAGRPIE
jgi:hypothetical protein